MPSVAASAAGPKGDTHITDALPYEVLQEQVRTLERVIALSPSLYREYFLRECVEALRRTVMFKDTREEDLRELAAHMPRKRFLAGEYMVCDGEEMPGFVIAHGSVRRWSNVGGREHNITTYCQNSVGLLHLYARDVRSRFTAECETDVVAYELTCEVLNTVSKKHPVLLHSIVANLSRVIREESHGLATPLTHQKSHPISWTATALAASVESFYRSALNAFINARLTGKTGRLFPNMQVQIPARVVYISGLKQLRNWCDNLDVKALTSSQTMAANLRTSLCLIPGIIMCPLSSVLEAVNAGEINTEPLTRRWIRGYAPRLVRETIFALGINQMADLFSERVGNRITQNEQASAAVGSVVAGVISGYLSHVPHALSTLRLFHPTLSYTVLWKSMWERQEHHVPPWIQGFARPLAAQAISLVFPLGVIRRTVQIVGTFTIINGITYAMRDLNLI